MTRNISRRTFLHGASGIAAAGALSGSVAAAAIPSAHALNDPNMPPGVKFRGVNLAGNFAQTTAADGNDIWASLWGAWDWSGLIAPQLDDIAKIGNTVRIIGNTLVMALGSTTLSQYLARWKQLLDHAQSLGLFVYPCGGDLGHWGNYTWAQSAQTYTQLAQLLKSYPNVIGVDIVNEASQTLEQVGWTYNQPEPVADLLPELGGIVRSVGLPVTYSRGIANSSGWTLDYFTDHLGDFLDFHVYYLPGAHRLSPGLRSVRRCQQKTDHWRVRHQHHVLTRRSSRLLQRHARNVRQRSPLCRRARLVRLRPWPDKRHAVGLVRRTAAAAGGHRPTVLHIPGAVVIYPHCPYRVAPGRGSCFSSSGSLHMTGKLYS